jgi:LysR family transcriptional regulator, cyn operon transcriptional activator
MELHQLDYLRAVVRTGSITRAAAIVHVAQPSVSRQIKLLEREVGVPLLHRVGRRIEPTEAALLLAACAERIFDELSETVDALAQLASSRTGTLRLCATETVVDFLLPPALTELRRQRPGVHVSVEMLGTDTAIEQVINGAVDLAFVVLPLADSRLEIHPLLEESILLALPATHPWQARKNIPLDEALASPDLLLSMPGHGLRAQLEYEAQQRALTLTSRIDLRSQQALLNMVAYGAGIAFVPAMSAIPRNGVVIRPVNPTITRAIGWIVRRGRRLPPVASTLIALLQARRGQQKPAPLRRSRVRR